MQNDNKKEKEHDFIPSGIPETVLDTTCMLS